MSQTAMITIRCTREEHEAIKRAAWLRRQSMNQYIVDLLRTSIKYHATANPKA